MFEKMSDGEIMVYLRNAALQMSRIAQERKLTINTYFTEDGYFTVNAGDYEVFRINSAEQARYDYRPRDKSHKWTDNVKPQQIKFWQEPEERVEEDHGK